MISESLSAVKNGDVEKLKKLLDAGIDINAQDDNGRSLLHHAASNGQEEVVKFLLLNGADVLLTTNKNNTVMHIALANRHMIMPRVILDNISRAKLQKLLDVKSKTSGSTALHVAAEHWLLSVPLLTYGAKVDVRNNLGQTPRDIAHASSDRECEVTRPFFRIIDSLFEQAAVGYEGLPEYLHPKDRVLPVMPVRLSFIPLVNCRNKDGRTIMQVLLLNGHVRLASKVLRLRVAQPMLDQQEVAFDPNRKNEVDQLAEQAKMCKEFWLKSRLGDTNKSVKRACRMLQQAHELLRGLRQLEGEYPPLSLDPKMKTLEDVLETLGFDPEQTYTVEGDDDCYYKILPNRWKKDVRTLIDIMELVVYQLIDDLVRHLTGAQIIIAAKENDTKRVQRLLDSGAALNFIDNTERSVLSHAAENGYRKIVKLLLKSGADIHQNGTLDPIYLSARKGHAKVVKLLLKKADPTRLARFIDWRVVPEGPYDNVGEYLDLCTALHAAAMRGRLDIVKMLLKYGANYLVLDEDKRTPLEVSIGQEVSDFLKLVEECFQYAKKGKVELIHKLKAMEIDEFLAIAGAKNREGQTIAIVAGKANAKNITAMILKMMREAKQNEK